MTYDCITSPIRGSVKTCNANKGKRVRMMEFIQRVYSAVQQQITDKTKTDSPHIGRDTAEHIIKHIVVGG